MSHLILQFAVCNYPHYVFHMIWLIMIKNWEACSANVNIICLRMPGRVHCARLCVSARLCVFWLGCVLWPARLVVWSPCCVLGCQYHHHENIYNDYTIVTDFIMVSRTSYLCNASWQGKTIFWTIVISETWYRSAALRHFFYCKISI